MAGNSESGRKYDQKMKPFLIYQYLMRYSDENNVVKTKKIIEYLKTCEISAERRSIYKDIAEINDGNYYLLAFDDKIKKMSTFCVDRMKSVRYTGEPRQGREEYEKINMESYAQEHFGMFGGAREHVTLRFIEPLLDTVVDRFYFLLLDDVNIDILGNLGIRVTK